MFTEETCTHKNVENLSRKNEVREKTLVTTDGFTTRSDRSVLNYLLVPTGDLCWWFALLELVRIKRKRRGTNYRQNIGF